MWVLARVSTNNFDGSIDKTQIFLLELFYNLSLERWNFNWTDFFIWNSISRDSECIFNFMRFWKSINTTRQRNGLFLAVLKHQQWTIVSTEAQVQHRGLDEVHQSRRILHGVRQTVFLIRIWNMVQLSLKGHLLRQIRKMEWFWSYRVIHGTCDPLRFPDPVDFFVFQLENVLARLLIGCNNNKISLKIRWNFMLHVLKLLTGYTAVGWLQDSQWCSVSSHHTAITLFLCFQIFTHFRG